jgi:hypothetical protein
VGENLQLDELLNAEEEGSVPAAGAAIEERVAVLLSAA